MSARSTELAGRLEPGDTEHRMHSMQPPTSHWGINSRLPDEPPLGYSINAVPDTSKVDVNR
jgi:hypothetical protein